MEKEILSLPEELLTQVELNFRLISLTPEELQEESKISGLIHDLYWFPDGFYYIFTKVNEGFGGFLTARFERSGLIIKIKERCFYPNPSQSNKNDFVHLPPDKIHYDWHLDIVKNQEYARFTIDLSPWKRKELDLAYTAQTIVKVTDEGTPAVVKHGAFRLNVNLFVLYEKLKGRYKK